jgi:hypothetical protein
VSVDRGFSISKIEVSESRAFPAYNKCPSFFLSEALLEILKKNSKIKVERDKNFSSL